MSKRKAPAASAPEDVKLTADLAGFSALPGAGRSSRKFGGSSFAAVSLSRALWELVPKAKTVAKGMISKAQISSILEMALGFSKGWAELALKKPPPFVPRLGLYVRG